MKHITLVVAVAMLLCACQETNHKDTGGMPDHFDNTVGKRIDTNMGLRWIENINGTKMGPQHGERYEISNVNLEKVIKSAENPMGISFHLGVDDNGIQHIVLAPIDAEMNGWAGIAIDANSDREVSVETAKAWARNYKMTHEGEVSSHSFGIDVFTDIGKHQSFEIVQGLDDAQNLALMAIVRNASVNGKTEGDGGTIIWDGTLPCPPYCAGGDLKK
jgi:hypothetical protein